MPALRTIWQGLVFLFVLSVILFMENFDLGITLHMVVYFSVVGSFLHSLLRPSVRSVRKSAFMLVYYSLSLYVISFLMYHDFNSQSRIYVAGILFITFFLEQIVFHNHRNYCVSPTMDDTTLSFEDLRYLKKRVQHRANHLKKMGGVVSLPWIRDIMQDLPRNCAIRYMAKESLSDTYFQNLHDSLDDPYVYLVFSDTGSAASNLIGLITNKPYNHLSISFDSELKTLVSYNGGERISPPGLNQEMIEWFYQKEDASIRIYRLSVTMEQKISMAKRIETINLEGSAYNLLGVTLGKSIQPNMMVCSEFVYSLLESVGANYFTKTALDVKPADLIELDYERKLEFVEAIQLSSFCDELVEKGKPLPKRTRDFKLSVK